MPRFVDLSAPITPSPPELPDLLRTDVEFSDHAEGARTIETMLGVGPELLRDGEGWALETFTRFGTHNSTIGGRPAKRIDELPLEWFFGPGVVLDMSHKAWDAPLHLQAAEAKERGEAGIFWAAHQADLEYCQIERLCGLAALPPTGFTVSVFPLRLVGGSAAPARAVAIVPG